MNEYTRLTKREPGGDVVFVKGPDAWPDDVAQRLADYEDSGLPPEICKEYKIFEDEAVGKGVPFKRIVELMNADAAGRVVITPELA